MREKRLDHQELNLKIDRDELMDPYILTPHNELNEAIYSSVKTFVEKGKPKTMSLCIHTQKFGEIMQEKVREIYREHYNDVLRQIGQEMNRVYFSAVVLMVLALFLMTLQLRLNDEALMTVVAGSLGAYFLWKMGDIVFQWMEIREKQKRITTALNAEIAFRFHEKKTRQ